MRRQAALRRAARNLNAAGAEMLAALEAGTGMTARQAGAAERLGAAILGVSAVVDPAALGPLHEAYLREAGELPWIGAPAARTLRRRRESRLDVILRDDSAERDITRDR